MGFATSTWGAKAQRIVRALAVMVLAFGALAILAGCGGGSDDGGATAEPTEAEPTQQATSPSPTATAEAERPIGFLGQHGIYAWFAPADLELYRALLPPQFDMPQAPLVVVFVADYYDINIPLSVLQPNGGLPDMVPYLEGAVLLQCEYQGRTGLHTITMPVDDDTANEAGRRLGFPKYVADEITLEQDGDGWVGRVMHEGRTVLGVSFTPASGATPQEETGGGRVSLFQLVPPAEGPAVNEVNDVTSRDTRTTSLAGTVTIQADPEAEWAGLIPAGAVGAVFREKQGASMLESSTP